MVPVLAYWDVRGFAQAIRNLLVHEGVEFEDKRCQHGSPPEYGRGEWFKDKFALGLKFPNLPYYIDDDVKITQSLAILRHLGRKYDLNASSSLEATELDVLEQQARDLCLILAYEAVPMPRYREGLKSYAENVKDMLEPWAKHLAGLKWVLGDRLTYVDFLLYEGLDWHRVFKPDAVQQYPEIVQYLERFEQLSNLKEYFASDEYKEWPIMGPLRSWGYNRGTCVSE
nr:glutathione S-transferase Mu 2-like [Dermacentor andersoni]